MMVGPEDGRRWSAPRRRTTAWRAQRNDSSGVPSVLQLAASRAQWLKEEAAHEVGGKVVLAAAVTPGVAERW
jgi:hypothetical protein